MCSSDKTKKCPKCGEVKSVSEFYKNRSMSDGFATYCKACESIYQKQRKTSNSHVYIVTNESNTLCKIGISTRSDRLRTLQSGSPVSLRMYAKKETPKYKEIEEALHKKYQGVRSHGEWYALTSEDLSDIITTYGFNIAA